MARGKPRFRGAEMMGRQRAAKYARVTEGTNKDGRPKPAKEAYDEIIYENAAFEEYYQRQGICAAEEWDDFMAIQRLPLPGQWDTTSKVDMKKDLLFKEIREQIINEDFRGALTRQEAVSMLPCLFLDIQPHHLVLDMCSSPGSKTSEMLDMLQWKAQLHASTEKGSSVGIPPVDAACFPTLHSISADGSHKVADVPCSGDGTLRKNLDVWRSWNTGGGHSMHPIQLSILYRGLQLLRVDGKIVYSTCSLNPLEDEAVIATVLSQQKGRVEIVDPPDLPGLRWSKGKPHWLVPSPPAKKRPSAQDEPAQADARNCNVTAFYCTFDEVPEEYRHRIRPTMFPPPGADSMSLEKCVRVLPHHNNTGGFFVCCLRKLAELDATKIFISNKSKVRATAEEKKRSPFKPQRNGDTLHSQTPAPNGPAESASNSAEAAHNEHSVKASYAVKPEVNPLLDGELLAERPIEQTVASLAYTDDDAAAKLDVLSAKEEEESLYSLASAASKPGSLFHILLPANCDAEGACDVQMITDFYGLSDKTSMLPDDLRSPTTVASLDPNLLFRRVHSRKKMFFLSKGLADMVNISYQTAGAHTHKKLISQTQSQPSELHRQLESLLKSKIKWMHAGITLLIKHNEGEGGQEKRLGARGWRVAQEGAALMSTFMRRRIIFVSLAVARFLLLAEARAVRSSELLAFENCKQVLNLSSCRDKDGYIEAGGVICIVCPTTVIAAGDSVTEESSAKTSTAAEVDEVQPTIASVYPIKNNPSFATMPDSVCVSCMFSAGGNLHAYMNKREARALARHLFSMPKEEDPEQKICQRVGWDAFHG
ncbi:hypothetical protein, conserved [Eimeria tenella]|uniref:SAM-dependent MTase RsmB/NOP-type domain-containing protein n=1 Tax=Eimeria tenella TaxID=5802 RepID=U6KWC2_EIMTE|nr:hypothetical protein, conserved [Eimeria tenella]CDJ42271.1 hypothetical protein, conserved [Eimeria tenella]|eukprot:XP_013233021.1 hypothetical protein, conserved [Eimeria tenella]